MKTKSSDWFDRNLDIKSFLFIKFSISIASNLTQKKKRKKEKEKTVRPCILSPEMINQRGLVGE